MHRASAAELKDQIEAERLGTPFVVVRDGDDRQRIVSLSGERLTVGRARDADLSLDWDHEVSRVHAELVRIGGAWTISDDGLSRNGSYVNAERITGRRRLQDGDVLRFGATTAVFRAPSAAATVAETALAEDVPDATLTATQKSVLVALCRPYGDGGAYATPAPNQQIAGEVFLSVDAVKTHLRTLFAKFGVEDLPQNQKRVKLVERALQSGAITPRDLREETGKG
ncbi:MAG: FHA domain-containing protein [Thermoleophilaceae bacterium]|nr:FHA domain-containing protein [Thermoleophilaceae bacterium]